MKKIFSLVFCFVFLLSFVSALEYDNIKTYDPITREATFKNSIFGIPTTTIGKARLNTPLDYMIEHSGYQKVAEFRLQAYTDYNDILKSIDLYDKKEKDYKNHKITDRTIDIKYKLEKLVSVDDYKNVCEIDYKNNSNVLCEYKIVGSHLEERIVWEKVTPAILKKNEYVDVGLFTKVKRGDYVEWIPTIYGVEVEEWASWNASLIVENSDDFERASLGANWTVSGTPDIFNSEWYRMDSADDDAKTTVGSVITNTTPTNFKIKIKRSSGSGSTYAWMWNDAGGNAAFYFQFASTNDLVVVGSVTTTLDAAFDNDWYLLEARNINWSEHTFDAWSRGVEIATGLGFINNYNYADQWRIGEHGGISLNYVDHVYSEVGVSQNATDNPPVITLNSPDNATDYLTSPIQINFSCYGSDDQNLTSVGFYVNNVLDQLNTSGINNTNYLFSKTLTDGNYNWTCEGTDNNTQTTKPTARTFRIHTTDPESYIHYPTGTLDYHLGGTPLKFNWTVNETGENLTSHIINCTFNYNGVVTELNNTLCTQINETTFTPLPGINTLNFSVTDEFGLINTSITTWNIKLFEINQTYNNETTEGSLETFLANLRLGSGYSITDAVLINYNGSSSAGQSFAVGSNTVLRKVDFLIPNVNNDTNASFYWSVTLSDSTALNLSSQNQTIYNLKLDNCSSNTVEIFNFTVVDEEKQTILPNATIEIAINIYDENREQLILNYSELFEGINPLRVCMNRNLSSDSMYLVDTVVRYEDTGNANEYYNIVGQNLTSGTETQKITLYDLNLTDSTEFQLSFTGSDFLPVENALVYVDRQYISENTFKTVELPKTDYNGQSVLHLVRNDVIYNIRIIKDGIVLGSFENLVAFCDDFTIGYCNIELNAFDSVESVFNVDEELGIIYTSPIYNETTNTISFNFLTSDGTSKTVLLEVTRNDIFGNRSICNSTLTSSGGTLTCNIDPNLDESVLVVSIYVDGVLTVKGSVELDTDNYGVAGYLVMFVMAMSFIFMFSGSKTGVLISIGLTFAGSLGMGIVSGKLIGIGASGIWLLVIIFVGIYKLNKERPA